MRRALLLLVLGAFLCACGGPAPVPAPAPAATETPAAPPAAPPAEAAPVPVEMPADVPEDIPNSPLTVNIVDLEGKPIAEAAAIVTEAANAFDQPLVRGSITGPEGQSDLLVPRDRRTFVRGWDPRLNYFANSFLTVEPGDAPLPVDTTVIMAPAAVLTAQFFGADGAPLPGETQIEVLFSHPEQGPWWPARAVAHADGRAIFDHVPAGKFDLSVSTGAHGVLEIGGVVLMPRDALDLGVVRLQ